MPKSVGARTPALFDAAADFECLRGAIGLVNNVGVLLNLMMYGKF